MAGDFGQRQAGAFQSEHRQGVQRGAILDHHFPGQSWPAKGDPVGGTLGARRRRQTRQEGGSDHDD
jgi:hypothetical protein